MYDIKEPLNILKMKNLCTLLLCFGLFASSAKAQVSGDMTFDSSSGGFTVCAYMEAVTPEVPYVFYLVTWNQSPSFQGTGGIMLTNFYRSLEENPDHTSRWWCMDPPQMLPGTNYWFRVSWTGYASMEDFFITGTQLVPTQHAIYGPFMTGDISTGIEDFNLSPLTFRDGNVSGLTSASEALQFFDQSGRLVGETSVAGSFEERVPSGAQFVRVGTQKQKIPFILR
jgi:hypothetical protein